MSGRPWYKRYPVDFIHGTMGLSLEEKGAYSLLLDLIYDRGGPIVDDARYLAGVCGVSVRKWTSLREKLIEAGKIVAVDGALTNSRAEKEIENLAKFFRERAESGAKGGRKSREKVVQTSENSDLDQAELEHAGAIEARSQKPESDIEHSDPGGSAPNGANPGRNFRKELFEEGVASLERQTGRTAASSRSLIGRWLRDAGEDCRLVLAKIRQAEADQAADPVAWIGEAVKAPANSVRPRTLAEEIQDRLRKAST